MKNYYKHINIPKERKLYSGFDQISHKLSGQIFNLYTNIVFKKKLKNDAKEIHKLSLEYANLGDYDIDKLIKSYQLKFKLNKLTSKEFLEAFAVVVELGYRVTGKRAYEVQIMGAIALVKKYIIQMATGEGKTLTASIAAVILGWSGKPVHILTSNDYLASRDAQLLEPFYNRANLSCGYVIGKTTKEERKEIYKLDLVYSTAKDILADFLKDRMQEEQNYNINSFLIDKLTNSVKNKDYLLRGLEYVIVDEADSVLADDAVTPLIISSKAENKVLKESVVDAHKIIEYFQKDKHYTISEKFNDITLTKLGLELIDSYHYSFAKIWQSKDRREFLIKQALEAKELYELNKHYIIKDGKVVIVDEKTGRIMSERSWGNGLHQAIEVKEGVEITDPTTTFAKMSFQRFFRLYTHLCGMSGTLQNLKSEFWQIYDTKTIDIPSRVPSKMIILKDKIYFDKNEKEKNLIKYIIKLHEKSLPILIGVTTIKDSESLAKKLKQENITCVTLNALHDEEEADIIKDAGEKNKITIATNMAGRGTDIHISEEVDKLGGLQVITTQRDKSRRIDMQFFGRCARQGQNGTALAFLSLEDTILKHYVPKWLNNYLTTNFHKKNIKKLSNLIYMIYQRKIEKDISNIRNKTLLKEFSIDDSMSYTS